MIVFLFSVCRCLSIILLSFCICACDSTSEYLVNADNSGAFIVKGTKDSLHCRLPDGEVSVLPRRPGRTVILLTSLLNLWAEAGGEVIARCAGKINVPPGAMGVPVVGTFNNPNVEKIIALQPDLVISSDVGNFRVIIPILKQNHIPYAFFSYVNYI